MQNIPINLGSYKLMIIEATAMKMQEKGGIAIPVIKEGVNQFIVSLFAKQPPRNGRSSKGEEIELTLMTDPGDSSEEGTYVELIDAVLNAYSFKRRPEASGCRQRGTRVFIGHGRSAQWRELKDFVSDRLSLPYDEFNRVPVAGTTNVDRLSQMLDNAAVAFLVLTAEDEKVDGAVVARQNVVHEAGLFQGRLGFSRTIIMFEDGCEQFSNADGLRQIRFPAGNVAATFEEVRQVLEREGLIQP
jgi:predicted nucleotide-binding protein